jgi:hypothetical protein
VNIFNTDFTCRDSLIFLLSSYFGADAGLKGFNGIASLCFRPLDYVAAGLALGVMMISEQTTSITGSAFGT